MSKHSDFIDAWSYRLLSKFNTIMRMWKNFYLSSDIFEICLFFSNSSSNIFIASPCLSLFCLGLYYKASKIDYISPLPWIPEKSTSWRPFASIFCILFKFVQSSLCFARNSIYYSSNK